MAPQQCPARPYEFVNILDSSMAEPVGTYHRSFSPGSISHGEVVFVSSYNTAKYEQYGGGLLRGTGGPVEPIIEYGDQTPTDIIFNASAGRDAISNGEVVFRLQAILETGLHYEILRQATGGALEVLAQTGDPAPTGTFKTVHSAAIDGADVGWVGSYGAAATGVFVTRPAGLSTIAKTGDVAAGAVVRAAFGPALDDGRVAFTALLQDDAGAALGSAILVSDGSTLLKIVKQGDLAPVGMFGGPTVRGNGNTIIFSPPDMDGGKIVFEANYGDSANELQQRWGVFISDGVTLTAIKKQGDPAPVGVFGRRTVGDPGGGPTISGDTVVFEADYGDDPFATSLHGVFVSRGGQLTQLLSPGASLFGSTMRSIYLPRIDEDGNIVFNYELADQRFGLAVAHPVPEPAAQWLGFLAASFGFLMRRRP